MTVLNIVEICVNVAVFPAHDDSAVLCYLEKNALLYWWYQCVTFFYFTIGVEASLDLETVETGCIVVRVPCQLGYFYQDNKTIS